MKEKALELAKDIDECPYFDKGTGNIIRRLVEELDAKDKLIESVKVGILTRAVLDERHGIK